MKKSYCILFLILFGGLTQVSLIGQTIQPIERSIGKLHISIDPRIELLAAIHSLSNNKDLANRDLPYSKDILNYFELFSSHEAIKITESLRQKYGFSYDAPVAFMLHLSKPPELELQIKFSDYLLKRSGESDLEQYRKSIKQFAEISNFETFWNSKISLYNQILDMTIANMGGADFVKIMEDYFNETQESYNVIITPAFYGGKGAFTPNFDGNDIFHACLSTTDFKDDIPYLNRNNLLFYVWHEYGHFFVNPLTEKYSDRVASVNKLFEPIEKEMSNQSYGQWSTCVNEHIIRATTIRLLELFDSQQSKGLMGNELRNHFIYIEPILEKLKVFENQRDKNKITFSEFYPELLNTLDSLLKIEYWKQFNTNFRGPINGAFINNGVWEEKISVIYPTQDLDAEALKVAQEHVTLIFERFFKSRGGVLLADTAALKTDLSEFGSWHTELLRVICF